MTVGTLLFQQRPPTFRGVIRRAGGGYRGAGGSCVKPAG
jgi:hypothetical protein